MVSMSLATLGWTAWWIALLVAKLAPSWVDGVALAATVVASPCALLGLMIAAVTLRARRTWILFVTIPLIANGSLLAMPWLESGLLRSS
jgi:hypothetical protein